MHCLEFISHKHTLLVNNTCNELVIFPGIEFYSGNNAFKQVNDSKDIVGSAEHRKIECFQQYLDFDSPFFCQLVPNQR